MKLEVLSINCADSPVNRGRALKMAALGAQIRKIAPDVVFFQELISKKSAEVLKDALLDYTFVGNATNPMKSGGLLIASKIPFASKHEFTKFNRQAYWNPLSWSDWYLGKGFLAVDVMAGKERIRLVDAHPLCNYFKSKGGQRALREQLLQIAQYANRYKEKMLVSGDFNTIAGSTDYDYFLEHSKMTDPLRGKKYQSFNAEAVVAIARPFSKMLYGQHKLDYTFYKGFKPRQVKQKIVLKDKYPVKGKPTYLTDHYGLHTEITL